MAQYIGSQGWNENFQSSFDFQAICDDADDGFGNWRMECVEDVAKRAVVTTHGIISVRLSNDFRVDLTVGKAIRIINYQSNIILTLASNLSSAALIHPSGSLYQYESIVDITIPDPSGNTKNVKMRHNSVSFTSEKCGLVYQLDEAGIRTTTETFSDTTGDISMPVFLSDFDVGPQVVVQSIQILNGIKYWVTGGGVENWIINGIRISQTADGLVRVGGGMNDFHLKTSLNGTAGLYTPHVHATASTSVTSPNDNGPHLFVKRGENRIHFDGNTLSVRYKACSAGFDKLNQLKVY